MLTIRGSDLTAVINRVLDVVGKDGQTLFFQTDPETNMLEVSAHNDLYLVRKKVPAKITKAKNFALAGELASRSFAYRDDMTLTLKNNALRFSSSKSSLQGELFTQQFETVRRLKRKSTHSIPKAVGEFLFKKLRKVALKACYEQGVSLTAMIRTIKNKMVVVVADGYHAAVLEEPLDAGTELNFNMPIGYLDQMEKLVGTNSAFDLHQDPNCLYVLTDDLELALPLIGSTPVEFDKVLGTLTMFSTPSSYATVDTDKIKKVLKTLEAVYDPESASFTISVLKKKGVQLELKSKFGRMVEVVEGENCISDKDSITMDWLSFRDVLDRVKDRIELKLHGKLVATIHYQDGTSRANYIVKGKSE